MRMSQCGTEEKAGHAGLALANKIRENLVQCCRHMRHYGRRGHATVEALLAEQGLH